MGYGRLNPDVRYGVKNGGKHLEDASDMPHVIDESESDTDGSVVDEWFYWLVFYTCGVLLFNFILVLTYINSSFVQMLKFHIYCHEHEIKM